jgi:hypothetical protein
MQKHRYYGRNDRPIFHFTQVRPQPSGSGKQKEDVMNIFAGLLFLQGHIANPDLAQTLSDHQPAEDYGQTYGNHVANEKQFREPWDKHRRDPSLHPVAGCS